MYCITLFVSLKSDVYMYQILQRFYYAVLFFFYILLFYSAVLFCCFILLFYSAVLFCCFIVLFYCTVLFCCFIQLFYSAVLFCCFILLFYSTVLFCLAFLCLHFWHFFAIVTLQVDLTRSFTFRNSGQAYLGIPVMAANMDTVGTFDVAIKMARVCTVQFLIICITMC